jgi:EpsI family protein
MLNISRRSVLIAALFGSSAYAAHELRPRRMLVDEVGKLSLKSVIPAQLEGWNEETNVSVELVNPQTQAALDKIYTEVLTRAYVNEAGHRVMLSIAYGANQSDDKAVHYPDVCYPAQGFTVSPKSIKTVNLGPKNISAYHLIAKQGAREEPLLYWATVGNHVVQGGMRHKLAQLSYGFNGQVPDGIIFRVSTIGQSPEREFTIQEQFLKALYHAVGPQYRPRIFGADA